MNQNLLTTEVFDWMDEDEIMIIGKHNCVLMNLKTGVISQMTTDMVKRRLADQEEQDTEDAISTGGITRCRQ